MIELGQHVLLGVHFGFPTPLSDLSLRVVGYH